MLLRRLKLAGKRCHTVTVRRGVVAPVGQGVARLGEGPGGGMLRALRLLAGALRFGDPGLGRLRLGTRGFGCRRRVAPAGKDQPGFRQPDPFRHRLVTLRRARLTPQRGNLGIERGHDVFEPGEIGFGRAQLLLGILAPHVQSGDPGGLFEHLPPFGRLGGDHPGDLALADQRGRMGAGRRIGEDQRDILRPHVAAVDPVGTASAALDPADHFEFGIVVAGIGEQHHFGEIARRALIGAGEDHVFHAAAAHRFGRVFAHHPANCFEQVRFAAAVRSDDFGQSRLDAQFRGFDKALETTEFEPRDPHN